MITDVTTPQPPPFPVGPSTGGFQFQEAALFRSETLDLAYTDAAGRSYSVHMSRETVAYAATYSATGRLDGGETALLPHNREQIADLRDGFKELKHDLKDLKHDLEDLGEGPGGETAGVVRDLLDAFEEIARAVDGFKKLLDGFLKNGGGRGPDGHGAPADGPVQQASVLAFAQTVTVEVAVDGPAAPADDPWTVENTAARLLDFAVDLFRGGDREEHAGRMAGAMEQGYREAETAFGGFLPPSARDTVDLAKELLEQWAESREDTVEAEEPPRPGLDLVA